MSQTMLNYAIPNYQRESPDMHRSIFLLLTVALVLCFQPALSSVAQSSQKVDIRAVDISFPDITIDFRVKDASGRDVLDLTPRDVQVIEDGGTVISAVELGQQIADTSDPERTVNLSDGQNLETLTTTGAAIGIVFDATTVLNGGDSANHVAAGRQAIEQFLAQTGIQAPSNPEILSLFIPIDSPEQQVQPAELVDFTHDRNAVINYLRQMPSRSGKTNLYAAIQEAVEDTATVAQQQGRNAVVLVVSDGGDAISGDTFNAIIERANASGVRICAFGVGTDKSLNEQQGGFRLNQLASATGGVYVQRPDEAAASSAFASTVTATPASLYTLRYRTSLIDDGKRHNLVVQVTLPDGTVNSQQVEFTGSVVPNPDMQLAPLGDVLLRKYVVVAVPIALLVSLLVVAVIGGLRWNRSQSLSRGITRR